MNRLFIDTLGHSLLTVEQKMDKDENNFFDLVEGMTPVDPKDIAAFTNEMTEKVIPEIVQVVEERRLLAAQNALRQLKHV